MDPIFLLVKSYLHGVLDSLKGFKILLQLPLLVFGKPKNEAESELDESSSSSSNTTTGRPRPPTRRLQPNRREQIKMKEEANVLLRISQCCCLNGCVFIGSMLAFNYGLIPLIHIFLEWMFERAPTSGAGLHILTFLSFLFGTIWIMPLFILTRVVNCLWFQDIADSAYKVSKGQPQISFSIGIFIADSFFALLVQILFLSQTMFIESLPFHYVHFLSKLHLCMLYALYAFEYKWCNMGWELHKRLLYIETNWTYFMGFGTIMTILMHLYTSVVISGCIFAVVFPFFILSANESTPVTNASEVPIKFFGFSVLVANTLFNFLGPGNAPMSKSALDAAITAANANDTFRQIRQQTPPVNVPSSRSGLNVPSRRSGSNGPTRRSGSNRGEVDPSIRSGRNDASHSMRYSTRSHRKTEIE